MSESQFRVFMAELAMVMHIHSVYPADKPMYLAVRKWLHKKLVSADGAK